MSKNGIKSFNESKKVIVLDSAISSQLRNGNLDAEERLAQLKSIYTGFTFVFSKHKNTGKNTVTYRAMAELFTKADKPELMAAINSMRFAKVLDPVTHKITPQFSPSQIRQMFVSICEEHSIVAIKDTSEQEPDDETLGFIAPDESATAQTTIKQ